MSSNRSKTYWRSPLEAGGKPDDPGAGKSDVALWRENTPDRIDRRNFLKATGFTLALGSLAGCNRAPVNKAVPFLQQQEGHVPGVAVYYATVCGACPSACGVIAKNRDGRPIKLEGLPGHPLSQGGLCAIGQASLLGLYDSRRFTTPQNGGKECSWDDVDQAIAAKINEVRTQGGAVRFLSNTVSSPTERAVIQRFLASFKDSKHVVYDPLSASAILDAHQRMFGVRALPRYHFEKAAVIASFDADFLGTWISPVQNSAGYRASRNLETNGGNMSLHVQFESRMSLTGTNADKRYRIAPGELGLALSLLAQRIAAASSAPFNAGAPGASPVPEAELDELAKRLLEARGRSLVISGSQDVAVQMLCNFVNNLLGNYGATVDLSGPSFQKQGNDGDLAGLVQELQEGKIAALFVYGANPAYDLPGGTALLESLKRVGLVVALSERPDETTAAAHFVCPTGHSLESWSDAEAAGGVVSIRQPAIQPLFDTRPMIESLNAWMGAPQSAYDSVHAHWQAAVHPRSTGGADFRAFWDKAVHDGFAAVTPVPVTVGAINTAAVSGIPAASEGENYTLVLYPKVGLGDGRHAYNSWLQELPDPVTKVTWDNYACLSVAAARELGVEQGDVLRIAAGGSDESSTLELPAYIQPGQHDKVVAVAMGYGQVSSARFVDAGPEWILRRPTVGDNGLVGKNAAPLLSLEGGGLRYIRSGVSVSKTGRKTELACTQTHHTITVPAELATADTLRRPIVQETTLAAFLKDPHSGQHHFHVFEGDLYPAEDHPYTGHRWMMAIDLTSCSGCSACVVACQVENNIPVVGRDEVLRRRDMQWMRIDRYYSGEGDEVDVIHQPMLCQHCENASCENVCPVLATVHTDEGLNAQVYNRCVGTRYCANNCAYKVRRFNWFNYLHEDEVENLVLNPDVSVRSRGIMEKCSFCVQRIQEAKIEAKRHGEPLADGAVKPACQQSCPMQAIVFGDANNPDSQIAKLIQSPRQFRVLEEINVRPSVHYLTLVRNRTEEEGSVHHG